ncbi:MAG: prepilin-type N-terminal cleavage/methylation domain-containing protein [Candidatus Omnitrophota bacterium]
MNNKSGFTLLEIIISILLLAITLAGGMALYFNANKIMALMVHKKAAMELADKKMEDLRDRSYVNVVDEQDFALKVAGLNATRTVSVSEPNSSYKQVVIEVNWKEADKSDKTVKLVSYVAP